MIFRRKSISASINPESRSGAHMRSILETQKTFSLFPWTHFLRIEGTTAGQKDSGLITTTWKIKSIHSYRRVTLITCQKKSKSSRSLLTSNSVSREPITCSWPSVVTLLSWSLSSIITWWIKPYKSGKRNFQTSTSFTAHLRNTSTRWNKKSKSGQSVGMIHSLTAKLKTGTGTVFTVQGLISNSKQERWATCSTPV